MSEGGVILLYRMQKKNQGNASENASIDAEVNCLKNISPKSIGWVAVYKPIIYSQI